MAVPLTLTTDLTQLMQTYYDKLFLSRQKPILIMEQFGQKRTIPPRSGKVIQFTKYTVLPKNTVALTEGENPTGLTLSATSITATVAEYGDYTKISSLLSVTAFDPNISEKVELFSDQCALSSDYIIATAAVATTTVQIANGKATINNLEATDVVNTLEIRKAVRTLKNNKALRFNGYLIGVINPYSGFDLMGDDAFVEAKEYAGAGALFEGEYGKWMGVRFVETTEPYTEAGAITTVYHNLIFGKEAYGIIPLANVGEKKIYVKNPGPQDTSNPLDRFSTCGWARTFTAKILNNNWIVDLKSGASA